MDAQRFKYRYLQALSWGYSHNNAFISALMWSCNLQDEFKMRVNRWARKDDNKRLRDFRNYLQQRRIEREGTLNH